MCGFGFARESHLQCHIIVVILFMNGVSYGASFLMVLTMFATALVKKCKNHRSRGVMVAKSRRQYPFRYGELCHDQQLSESPRQAALCLYYAFQMMLDKEVYLEQNETAYNRMCKLVKRYNL